MAKNFMKTAVKRPGALRTKAKKAGALKNGKISATWLNKKAKMKATTPAQKRTKRQAVLAKTFKKFRPK